MDGQHQYATSMNDLRDSSRTDRAEHSRDEAIGANLARLREPMSQQTLADAMRGRGHKWSQTTVWKVETGARPLRLAEAYDVSLVLRCDLLELVTDTRPGDPSAELQALSKMARESLAKVVEAQEDLSRISEQLAALGSELPPGGSDAEVPDQMQLMLIWVSNRISEQVDDVSTEKLSDVLGHLKDSVGPWARGHGKDSNYHWSAKS